MKGILRELFNTINYEEQYHDLAVEHRQLAEQYFGKVAEAEQLKKDHASLSLLYEEAIKRLNSSEAELAAVKTELKQARKEKYNAINWGSLMGSNRSLAARQLQKTIELLQQEFKLEK